MLRHLGKKHRARRPVPRWSRLGSEFEVVDNSNLQLESRLQFGRINDPNSILRNDDAKPLLLDSN
jgi:hypothetical protein